MILGTGGASQLNKDDYDFPHSRIFDANTFLRENGFLKAMEVYRHSKKRKIIIIGGGLDAFHCVNLLLNGPYVYGIAEDNENLVFFSKRLTDEDIYSKEASTGAGSVGNSSDEEGTNVPDNKASVNTTFANLDARHETMKNKSILTNKSQMTTKHQTTNKSQFLSANQSNISGFKSTNFPSPPTLISNNNLSLFSIAKMNTDSPTKEKVISTYMTPKRNQFAEKYKKFVNNMTFGSLEKERFKELRQMGKMPKFEAEEIVIIHREEIHVHFKNEKEAKAFGYEYKVENEPSSSNKKNMYLRAEARDLYFKVILCG